MTRRTVELRGLLRLRYKSASPVVVTSISTHGCSAQPGNGFSIGAEVWVRLPGVESWSGEVRWVEDHRIGMVWSDGGRAGLRFLVPIHTALAGILMQGRRPDLRRYVANLASSLGRSGIDEKR